MGSFFLQSNSFCCWCCFLKCIHDEKLAFKSLKHITTRLNFHSQNFPTYFHMISAADNLFHMCTIIYSFVMSGRRSTHSMHSTVCISYMFDAVILLLLTAHVTSPIQHKAEKKCYLTSAQYRSGRWTSCSLHTPEFNVYAAYLFMKYNMCSHCMIRHIYAFICGEKNGNGVKG